MDHTFARWPWQHPAMSLNSFFTAHRPQRKRESCGRSSLKSHILRASTCLTPSSCLRIPSVAKSPAMIYRPSSLAPKACTGKCQVILSSPKILRYLWDISTSDGREACRAVTQNLLSQTTAFELGSRQCARVCVRLAVVVAYFPPSAANMIEQPLEEVQLISTKSLTRTVRLNCGA